MKMKQLAQKKMVLVTPLGNHRVITFFDLVAESYKESKNKGRLTAEQYMWLNLKELLAQWDMMEKEVAQRIKQNQKVHNKARIKAKWAVLTALYRFKAFLKGLFKKQA